MTSTDNFDEKGQQSLGLGRPLPTKISAWRTVVDQARITQAVVDHKYEGSGTREDPYIVTWIERDPGNPMELPSARKWGASIVVAVGMLATAFSSSAFSGMPYRTHF
jgi:hypothetical protein